MLLWASWRDSTPLLLTSIWASNVIDPCCRCNTDQFNPRFVNLRPLSSIGTLIGEEGILAYSRVGFGGGLDFVLLSCSAAFCTSLSSVPLFK